MHALIQEPAVSATADSDFDGALPIVLPALRVVPNAMQIFMFSAITWNRHQIHYSRDAALREGHPDVVVQRALIGNFFARHAQAWLDRGGAIRQLSWKVLASAYPGQALDCVGFVTERLADPGARLLRYEAQLLADGGREIAVAEGVLCIHGHS